MSHCAECTHWLRLVHVVYGDGTVITNWQAPANKGNCQQLSIETTQDFGCTKFLQAVDPREQIKESRKTGSPWQYWIMGDCPKCGARGMKVSVPLPGALSQEVGCAACHNCAGTGRVRYYDDGYIGEEQSRLHPVEKAINVYAQVVKDNVNNEDRIRQAYDVFTKELQKYKATLTVALEAVRERLKVIQGPDVDGTRLQPRARHEDVFHATEQVFADGASSDPA